MVKMILREIVISRNKRFQCINDNKPFFHQTLKKKQEACENLIEMSRNDGYTTRSLSDYLHHQIIKNTLVRFIKTNKHEYSSIN